MGDGKFHLPGRKKDYSDKSQPVRLTTEAYNVLIEMYNDSQLPMSQIASKAILYAAEHIIYDREDQENG